MLIRILFEFTGQDVDNVGQSIYSFIRTYNDISHNGEFDSAMLYHLQKC